ncbi:SiaB family protein kinase [Thiomicrospira microaerophila]|uniref:SiaB family protein kinase n=1 Tax=Thiomicrospira microaerophila TaxID=406020 RepID=UPI000ABF60E1|nr:SiaB family protein kinase [Thiomicrospira microaerophila]
MNISAIKNIFDSEGIVFLVYTGFLSQTVISAMTSSLEKEAEHGGLGISESTHIYTVFIEMAQNIMNYSRAQWDDSHQPKPEGLIVVGKYTSGSGYYVQAQNVVLREDKEKIEPKLIEIQSMDVDAIKKRYREVRKSGRDVHAKGGGIGFYEIAKRCSYFEYQFKPIDNDKFEFSLTANIAKKKELEN